MDDFLSELEDVAVSCIDELTAAIKPTAAIKLTAAAAAASKPAAAAASKPMAAAASKPMAAAAASKLTAAASKPTAAAAANKPAAAATSKPAPAKADKLTISKIADHVREKGMWAGALNPIQMELTGAIITVKSKTTDEGEPREVDVVELRRLSLQHTPALLKSFDEIITNASDHAKGTGKVTTIKITFDPKTGVFSVYNDGPGISTEIHEAATEEAGREIYIPEVAFAYFLAGSNIEKELDNVKGGINGLGAKIANVHSLEFNIKTNDGKREYEQTWFNRLRGRRDPIITVNTLKRAPQFTQVTIVPAYEELGYPKLPAAQAHMKEIDAWLRMRAHQAAAYSGKQVTVTYNGQVCETRDSESLAKLMCSDENDAIVITGMAKAADPPYNKHPWNISVVVLPAGKRAPRTVAAANMAIVNGVVSNKGRHIIYIKQILSDVVGAKMKLATKGSKRAAEAEKKISMTETLAGVRIVMIGAIPGAEWGGQRKDELQVADDKIERYVLQAAFLKRVAETVAERNLIEAQGGKPRGVKMPKNYRPAKHAGSTARKASTCLLAAEGDSAITTLKAGLTQTRKGTKPGDPTFEWCGIISLQGVIINAAREVSTMTTAEGESVCVRSSKLRENLRLKEVAEAFGLRYDFKYDTEEQLATLRYGRLILCVDQDLDGTGKIAPLVLVWIHTFWPALIKAGRIGRLMTPLVRAYPKKGDPVEFFYEAEFESWLSKDPSRVETHRIKYYKGLASHDDNEVARMFKPETFHENVYTYKLDEDAQRLFNVYFGSVPALRKEALSTPVEHLDPAEAEKLRVERSIPIAKVMLDIDTASYKNAAVRRQIPGIIDGQNPARRKIICGAMQRFKGNGDCKVFQLGGYVADKMAYHHGDNSLGLTIVYLAQGFPGARRFPFLKGIGQFGDRHGGKAGSPRYISVGLNSLTRYVFPEADRWILPYVFEDGERAEPEYFVPVVPLNVLETYKIVSEGWNHTSFGRDLDSTMRVVEAYINGDADLVGAAERLHEGALSPQELKQLEERWPLPVSIRNFSGRIRDYRGEPYSFAAYVWEADTNTIVISDLPIGVATAKYLETLTEPVRGKENPRAKFIKSIDDLCTTLKVHLRIKLNEGAFDEICRDFGSTDIDPIEDAFLLRTSLRPHLNYYSDDGGVLEMGSSYLAAVLYWAHVRRDLYKTRLERERIILELSIAMEEQTVQYIAVAVELDLARVDDEEVAAAALSARGFKKFDRELARQPKYTPIDQIAQLATEGPHADYSYLLDLKERDLLRSAVDRREKRIKELRKELETTNSQLFEPVPGASVWRSEIKRFLDAVS